MESGWLAQSRYLTGAELTLADFAAYMEIGQLKACFTKLFDFEPFPNVRRWLEEMKQVDEHDDAHVVLSTLGDISVVPPPIEAIKQANMSALTTLKKRVAALTP